MNSESYINRRVSIKLQNWFVRGGVSLNFKVRLASLRMDEHRGVWKRRQELADVTLVLKDACKKKSR